MDKKDLKILRIYQFNTEKLRKAVKKHVPAKTTISYKVNQPIRIEGDIDEAVEAGLVSCARLFLGRNTSKFERVLNILSRHHKDDMKKITRLREFKKAWKGVFGPHPLFRIGSEEDGLTNKRVFDMIVNGSHLHSDFEEFDKNFELQQSWTYPMLRIQLRSLIEDIHRLTTMLNLEFVQPILESNHVNGEGQRVTRDGTWNR